MKRAEERLVGSGDTEKVIVWFAMSAKQVFDP